MGISLIGPADQRAIAGDTGNILDQSAGVAANQSAPAAPTPVVRPGKDYNTQAVKQGIATGRFKPPPPPPQPRPFRDVEQDRIDQERRRQPLGLLNADAFGIDTGNIIDLATAESREKAMQSQLDQKPLTDEELGDFNTATARSGEKTELQAEGGNLNQLAAHSYDPDAGGYQFFTADEYSRLKGNRKGGPLQMEDIAGTDASGRRGTYVYLAGNTSLTADNLSISQADVWAQMAPQERREYLNARGALSSLRKDAPQRYDVALRANDIAVSAQHRYLIGELEKGKKPNQIRGGFFDAKEGQYQASNAQWDQVPNFIVWQETNPDGKLGMKSIKTLSQVYESVLQDVTTDRHMAGELVTAMLAANMMPGASAKYVQDYMGYDSQGRPIAQWNPADWNDNLRVLVQEVARRQKAGAVPGASMDSFWQVIKNTAAYNNKTATSSVRDVGDGSGGGYSRYYGGGGGGSGGFTQRTFLSDPTMLAAQLDSIARARLGRVANADERAQFIAYFHQLETQYSAAYNGGGVATQPDPQGQAVAWIEGHNSGEQAGQTSGEYITALAQFLRGPGLSKGA